MGATSQPLEKDQVLDLIDKLKYDDKEIKKKFIERVRKDLYEKHKSFLSSPLLATMMLITFREFADIPEKIHLFYEQAFDALFAKHDATKEGFKRTLYTNLPSDDFKRFLSYLCLVSYYEEKYEFKDDDLVSYIKKGLKIDNASIDVSDFMKDLFESICVMQRDGLHLVFSHRTFQEFFSAYALARFSIRNSKKILMKIAHRPTDSVIQMLFDMNQELVETQFVIPALKEIIERHKTSNQTGVLQYLDVYGSELIIRVDHDGEMQWGRRMGNELDVARRVIGGLYPRGYAKRYGTTHRARDKQAALGYVEALKMAGEKAPVHLRVAPGMKRSKKRKDIDTAWLDESGIAAYFRDERTRVERLLNSIEQRRSLRSETMDEVFGFKN